MVERSLSMREVRGSIPRTSNRFLIKTNNFFRTIVSASPDGKEKLVNTAAPIGCVLTRCQR